MGQHGTAHSIIQVMLGLSLRHEHGPIGPPGRHGLNYRTNDGIGSPQTKGVVSGRKKIPEVIHAVV
jgi:hypothetical protein